MKIDKNYAFELLKKLEERYPDPIDPNTDILKSKIKNKHKAHIRYLLGEGFIIQVEPSHKIILSSKAINLLTDEIDMETWIKKNKKLD